MQHIVSRAEAQRTPKRRNWLVILDYLYYLLLVAAILGFAYYLFGYRSMIALYLPFLLEAAGLTIGLSISSMILAVIFGFIGAMGRLSRYKPIRTIAMVYVEVVRGTPVLVQILLWYFGVGVVLYQLGFDPYSAFYQLMTALQSNSLVPDGFSAMFYGVLALSFNYGAYLTEVFRAGIETVNKGQTEAALSLGLSSRQTMRHIILPQAFRITIPPFTNYFITLVQDSALLSVLGVVELEQTTGSFADPLTNSNAKLFVYILGAIIFFVICYSLALLARYLEGRMAKAY